VAGQPGRWPNSSGHPACLCGEYGYTGRLESVQRCWRHLFPVPAIRARQRGETPPEAQAQGNWVHFPGDNIVSIPTDLLALRMMVSFSRKQAIVVWQTMDMLAWLGCHSVCFTRLGSVLASVHIDNKTAISRRAVSTRCAPSCESEVCT
jgi:hypothetical protein